MPQAFSNCKKTQQAYNVLNWTRRKMLDKKHFVKENISSQKSIKHSMFVAKIRSCGTFHLPWRATFPWNWLCYFNMWSTTLPNLSPQAITFLYHLYVYTFLFVDWFFKKTPSSSWSNMCRFCQNTWHFRSNNKNELLHTILSTKIFRNSSGNCWGLRANESPAKLKFEKT